MVPTASSEDQLLPGPAPGRNDLFIVGIGASAGGIQALQEFFTHVPEDSGMAYVVILHLSPDHDSKLAELLRMVTPIPVTQVTQKTKVLPDNVYVVPPNKHLQMEDGNIKVSPNMEEEDRRAPVDIFFRTLASTHGPAAVCVILSGTGANGSMGLKRIKEMGGAAFVQNPREAEFNEMPRKSISTELVDDVLPVAQIPAKIIAYKKNIGTVQIPEDPEKRAAELEQALREIFNQLRSQTGHDFSNYKRPTVLRRIERRINVRNLPNLPAYASYLKENPDEITALLKDLLISVTNFSRDKKAFETIEQDVLPAILRLKKPEDQVRIWVPGCATGEEAYSMAILFAERTLGVMEAPRVQIFATDIDESAISFAREGIYTLNDAADVSPERLSRFFTKEGERYRIRREIREMIMFATHNFLKDPPFSHLDLVSCRNVLIYMNQAAQERILQTFHFALKPSGFLFLGSSESADNAQDLYISYRREFHIYRSRPVVLSSYPVPDSYPAFRNLQPMAVPTTARTDEGLMNRLTLGELHMRLLEHYAPPSVVVNEGYDIVHLSQKAGRYLQIGGGEPTQNLLKLIRQEIRFELRAALFQAVQQQKPTESKVLTLQIEDRKESFTIQVRPIFGDKDVAKGLILVLFEPQSEDEALNDVIRTSDEPVARQLEEELNRMKTELRASIEQHSLQAEELRASNEELQAMNEELRSAAEELETSKEELQSINEELRTVNQELKVKVEETTIAGNNLQNLINSADIATIFLDRNFKVALFTPPAKTLFNLISNDIGRPLSDITNKLDGTDILSDAELVLEKRHIVEREVRGSNGHLFMMRILPYRSDDDRINGLVITFFDINERARTEEALRLSEERYRTALQSANMGAWDWDIVHDKIIWNDEHYTLFGLEQDHEPKSSEFLLSFVHPQDQQQVRAEMAKATGETETFRTEFRITRSDNSKVCWLRAYGRVVAKTNGMATRMVGVMYDITENKLAEQQKDDFIGIASHELKTPVTSIKAFAEILQEQLEKTEDQQNGNLMLQLNQQVDRLADLITNLLDTTKIVDGGISLSMEPTDLNSLITEKSKEVQRTTVKHRFTYQLENVPLINADKERIGQVITNLLTNAVKYSPEGGEVHIMSVPNGKMVKVTIADKGIGIAAESQSKIFERFFRISNPVMSTYPGMGLGLYISAGIVRQHGGAMTVESEEGRGSAFSFTLPM